MKKRLLSIVLSLAVVISLTTVLAPAARAVTYGPYTVGNMTWRVDVPSTTGGSVGTLTIGRRSGYTGNVPIPNYTAGSRPPWFIHSAQIDQIILEAGVTEIGNYAFADFGNLKEVVIRSRAPSNVTRIGNDAFRGCSNLEDIMESNAAGSEWHWFDTVTVGSSAFYNCYSLRGLRMHNPTSVGADAFVGCRSLGSINIDAATTGRIRLYGTVTNGVMVEVNAAGNPIRMIKSTVSLVGTLTGTPPDQYSLYTIPGTVTTIDSEAFAYLENVESFTLPASVTTIRDRAFAYNPDLLSATFEGDAPTSFGANVFYGADDDFTVYFYPSGQRWTTPRWQGYRSEVNNSRLQLDRYVIVMEVGTTAQLRAVAQPVTANQSIEWNSDDLNVAVVSGANGTNDSIGIITAKAAGTAVITAQALYNNQTAVAQCTIIVLDNTVPATVVLLDQSRIQAALPPAVVEDPPRPPVPVLLTAYVYPYPATVGEQEDVARDLVWSSSNPAVAAVSSENPEKLTREIIIRSAGTTTITVRTPDGRSSASCVVTVTAASVFIPITDITLSTSTVAMGARIDLNAICAVRPENATNGIKADFGWELVPDQTTITGASVAGNFLSVPWGQTGTVAVRVIADKGRADVYWGYNDDLAFTKVFTFNVVSFVPVTGVIEVPTLAYVGVPLQLRGTVAPAGASYSSIEWSLEADNTDSSRPVLFNASTGVLTAQAPGTVRVKATVKNGVLPNATGVAADFIQTFIIRVDPYVTHRLDLRANPGGTVGGAGAGQFASGEVVTITASANAGYMFSGWYTNNGGSFADASRATTQYTMPGNDTAVYANFTYTGLPSGSIATGWGGGVILPTPVHYFTNNSIYTRNSSATFGHVTMRDFQLFSYVTLDGRTLTRNAHYTANRSGGYTEIVLANGYLNALEQGAHTLTVYFSDYVSVTAVFTVIWTAQVSTDYDDVYSSDWYAQSVAYVSERGWMSGRAAEPRRFRPNDPVTQGEVVDALYRMTGSPTILDMYGQALQGRDAAYEWVLQNGILPLGGFYNLNSSITRQDVAVIFARMVSVLRLRYPVVRAAPSFADSWQIDANARNAVNDIYRAGVMGGRSANTFVPLGYATRAEFAAILQRFSEAMGRW